VLGAQLQTNLTSDVTHLIVGDWKTPKFKYVAKERPEVKVVKPAFVDAVRELWMREDDINIETLEYEHRWRALENLKICLTGFRDCESSSVH
jgi:DNA replication regulator DPB11